MNASQEVLKSRKAELATVFASHSAYLDSRWFGSERFIGRASVPNGVARWRLEPPTSFLVLLLQDLELEEIEQPPIFDPILSTVDDPMFRRIVEWLRLVLPKAAQLDRRDYLRARFDSYASGSIKLRHSSVGSGTQYSWVNRDGERSSYTSSYDPVKSYMCDPMARIVEDRSAVLQIILSPVSRFLNTWVAQQSWPRISRSPSSFLPTWRTIPVSSLVNKMASARAEAWYPLRPMLPGRSRFDFEVAISTDWQYENLVAWLEAVVLSILKTTKIKRARRECAMSGFVQSLAPKTSSRFSAYSSGGSFVEQPPSATSTTPSAAMNFDEFVARTPKVPNFIGRAGPQRKSDIHDDSKVKGSEAPITRTWSWESGASDYAIGFNQPAPRSSQKGQGKRRDSSMHQGTQSRWSWSTCDSDSSGKDSGLGASLHTGQGSSGPPSKAVSCVSV
jgi:hypothetical protein